ncbi:phosphoribosylanthranilate isomerase [Lysinibacillus sp. fkY74-1]|uniref:N-(5'-phosphoribosyl)anthranilate isomerase n=2 Tax=Lysinibacillus TaxID=400634 RepID=W7RNV8_LYSSH|nr:MULTISPECIES: phosphoribosylanthranilate isomerase [Lysinibacillus]MBE5082830.1 phosphoribosylanthranilate isomerase [Bacillus thuringiensis]AMO32719.1 N-(5'-phosphoribosyl)anthranilate isomerase [Lysinibacillus sphaericus]AMR92179.1 N-(5'-phosphoribosyl)anthranilate isomerase [Lysinibacillus sphaericus]ANA46228.1 N-(5'-phosphoribosyl)anthranilate isomerase [Lysinibacillus sphaericus]EWH33277.1 N-(5'-phosphoribosyl)anthranilate isomerase [Lysinibacillus sphaericus CBAM5]
MTKVKICGLQELEHIQTAIQAGADAVGFVFAPSKRRVSIEQARLLAKQVPQGVLKIGVFVNPTAAELQEAVERVPLDYVQYHGEETATFILEQGYPAIKALSIRTKEDVQAAANFQVDYYLFDAPGTTFKGGSGQTFDWTLLDEVGIPRERLILAGGLKADNVEEAITAVDPYMVDVSSGVETDGIKDHKKIRTFLQVVKRGDK